MNAVVTDIWPHLMTALLAAIATYVGVIHNLKVRVAILESKMNNIEHDVREENKNIESLRDLLLEVKMDIASIKTTLNIIEPKR